MNPVLIVAIPLVLVIVGMGRVMSVFNLDQGMRSIGSIILGTSATLFGASLGLALTAAASLIVTTALFYRLLGKKI